MTNCAELSSPMSHSRWALSLTRFAFRHVGRHFGDLNVAIFYAICLTLAAAAPPSGCRSLNAISNAIDVTLPLLLRSPSIHPLPTVGCLWPCVLCCVIFSLFDYENDYVGVVVVLCVWLVFLCLCLYHSIFFFFFCFLMSRQYAAHKASGSLRQTVKAAALLSSTKISYLDLTYAHTTPAHKKSH